MKMHPLLLLAFGVFGMFWGLVLGLNLGVAAADKIGPQAACEQIRIQLLDCSKLKERGQQP